jgi:cell volume regulation protein A
LPQRYSTLSFAEGLGWIAQIGLFVLLGLYVDPTKLPAALVPGILIGLMVLLIARPLSVIAAALPFRLPWRHQAFLSYSGLRGAVPIVLALIPLTLAQRHSAELVAVIVVAVVIYTLLQGTSLPAVARLLRVVETGAATEVHIDVAPLEEMGAHVLQVRIPEGSRMHGVYLTQLRLPVGAVVALVLRDGSPAAIDRTTRLQAGDQLLIVTPQKARTATERRLRAVARGGALADWFGAGERPMRASEGAGGTGEALGEPGWPLWRSGRDLVRRVTGNSQARRNETGTSRARRSETGDAAARD